MGRKRKARPSEQQQTPQQEEAQPIEEQTNPENEQSDPAQEHVSNIQENEQQNMFEDDKETENEEQTKDPEENNESVAEPLNSADDAAEDDKETENEEQTKDPEENNEGVAEPLNSADDAAEDEQVPPPEANGGEKEEEEDDEEGEKGIKEKDFEEEPVEKLLEPFSKEQLAILLKEAVSKYPDFIESVQKLGDADPAQRKIFVHGLGWDANAETLTSVFGKYGEIEDCKAVCDKVSGKSKGYGFILFKHRAEARKALEQPQKKIGNRMASCQLASAGPVPAPPPTTPSPPVSEYTQRKIFVSNVSADVDPKKLLEFFSNFGEIEGGPLGLDKQTGKPKGFALFVYKTIESAKKALEEPNKNFEGHSLHCQKAVDGPKYNKQPYYQQHNQNHHQPSRKGRYSSSGGTGSGHLMNPSGPAVGFNQAVPAPGLSPAVGQALNALTALTQGGGLGIPNLLGGFGAPVNQGGPPVMNNAVYGHQGIGGYGSQYGNQPANLGGYQNPQLGQGSDRLQQGGPPPYMGHGR